VNRLSTFCDEMSCKSITFESCWLHSNFHDGRFTEFNVCQFPLISFMPRSFTETLRVSVLKNYSELSICYLQLEKSSSHARLSVLEYDSPKIHDYKMIDFLARQTVHIKTSNHCIGRSASALCVTIRRILTEKSKKFEKFQHCWNANGYVVETKRGMDADPRD
jgi:hypothetical protein